MNTGDPAQVVGYRTSRGGTGLVQPQKSTTTQVVARASGDEFAVSVNFGYAELLADYSQTREITLKNNGTSAASFSGRAGRMRPRSRRTRSGSARRP